MVLFSLFLSLSLSLSAMGVCCQVVGDLVVFPFGLQSRDHDHELQLEAKQEGNDFDRPVALYYS